MSIIVEGEGPLNCQIAFIGEAPGADEEQQGRPFVGKAGRVFDELLHSSGIARSSCYITNVVKERPANNLIAPFISFNNKGEATTSPEYRRYEEQLYKELSKCSANILVALGNISLYALTRQHGILRRRGSLYTTHSSTGLHRKVMGTIHPAAILHKAHGGTGMYNYRYYILHDLSRILTESDFKEDRTPARNFLIKPSFDEAIWYLDKLLSNPDKLTAFDIEVINREISCISLAQSDKEAISIPFISSSGDYFNPEQELSIWLKIANILENPAIPKVAQNAMFDTYFLFEKYGIRTTNFQDTMIAQAMVAPELPKGLDFLCSIYSTFQYYKDEGKEWSNPSNWEDFWTYNAKDSACLIEILPAIMKDVVRLHNEETYWRQTKIMESLLYMEAKGIRMSAETMEADKKVVESEMEDIQKRLNEIAGKELNPRSPKQLATYFYIDKKIKPYTKDGAITTDETAMVRLARKGYEEAALILKYREKGKLSSTYMGVGLDPDGRIRSAFKPATTKTGRLSSGKTIFNTGQNMQNWPEEMRKYMVADEGKVFYEIDLSQAENRIVAYIAPEPNMIKAFERGIDLHRLTASMIFGKPFNQISDEPGSAPIGSGKQSERFWGKKANHGLNYGQGYKKFALVNEIPESEALMIVEHYHMAYPGINSYHKWVVDKLGRNRMLINCLGRSRLFLGRWGEELFDEAYNFIPQSTVADIINGRGLNYVTDNQDLFQIVELCNQMHDSIEFQISLEHSWTDHVEALRLIVASLEQPLVWKDREFVIPAEIKMGLNLKDMVKVTKGSKLSEVYEKAKKLHEKSYN